MTVLGPHPRIAPLASLLGRWRGRGAGKYPSIEAFEYEEELRFWHTGRPWLGYEQRTRRPGTGDPMHSEVGYWRPLPDGGIELVVAHSFGITEVSEGRVEGTRITVASKALVSSSSAKVVNGVTRAYELDGDELSYELEMALGEESLQNHLSAALRRVPSG